MMMALNFFVEEIKALILSGHTPVQSPNFEN